MSEVSYVVIAPEKIKIRYPSIEEATEAAKEYLKEQKGKFLAVTVHEVSNNSEKRGRILFQIGGRVHIVDLELS